MTDGKVNLETLRGSLQSLSRGDLLVIAQRAIELLPGATLPALLGDRVQIEACVDGADEGTSLLDAVRRFHATSMSGSYYEDFPISARSCTEQFKGTYAFMAEFDRLVVRCVREADVGPRPAVREAFELLFGMLRHIDQCHDDVIFFADEGGSWNVGVPWRVVVPAYFRCLAETAGARMNNDLRRLVQVCPIRSRYATASRRKPLRNASREIRLSIAKKLSAVEIERIYSGANSAVWHSHQCAAASSRKTTREEDYVATLVRVAVPLLATRWSAVLEPRGIAVRVSGVFCHGRPQVKFAYPGSPVELADLLIVHLHATKSKSTARALLIQAKMSDDGVHTLAATDAQLHLFTNWPDFNFIDASMDPATRILKETGKGSRYALIRKEHDFPEDISWPDQSPWAVSKAGLHLDGKQSFPKALGNVVLGLDGRTVNLKRPGNDWSRLIKELLETTGAKTFRRANIGLAPTARLTEATFPAGLTLFISESVTFAARAASLGSSVVETTFFANAANLLDGGGGGDATAGQDANQDSGGMSSLIIETQEID